MIQPISTATASSTPLVRNLSRPPQVAPVQEVNPRPSQLQDAAVFTPSGQNPESQAPESGISVTPQGVYRPDPRQIALQTRPQPVVSQDTVSVEATANRQETSALPTPVQETNPEASPQTPRPGAAVSPAATSAGGLTQPNPAQSDTTQPDTAGANRIANQENQAPVQEQRPQPSETTASIPEPPEPTPVAPEEISSPPAPPVQERAAVSPAQTQTELYTRSEQEIQRFTTAPNQPAPNPGVDVMI